MPRVPLTDRFCATAKSIATQTDYFDAIVPGLALRVAESGRRTWCYLYTSPRDGKRARATIGTYPATPLIAAREKAGRAKGHVEAGQDPRLVLEGQGVAGMTVAGLVDAYLADPEKAALRSKAEIERRLRKNVVPLIGQIKISELRRRDVRTVTDAILKRSRKVEATRVFEDVRAVVRWAVQNEYLDANPLDGMNKPAEATSSNRVLSDEEIQTLWKGLPDTLARSEQCQRIVRLCLVTAQRVGEVAGMTRAELDLKAREWRLPGNRTKNGHPHVVPLSDLAISIITEPIAAADADNGHKVEPLFPCGDGSLSPVAVARTILRANEISKDRPKGRFGIAPWSAHDLRRTALTGMARLGVAPIVLGHVANHRTTTRAGVTLAVYSQYTYDKEKRAALELWASHLVTLCGASDAATPNKAPSANLRKVGQSNRRGVGRPAAAPGAKDVDYYQFFLDVGLAIGKPWRPIPIGDMTLEEQSDFFAALDRVRRLRGIQSFEAAKAKYRKALVSRQRLAATADFGAVLPNGVSPDAVFKRIGAWSPYRG